MRAIITAGLALALLACASPAGAQESDSRQEASFRFTTTEPGAPSGIVLRIDYVNPEDRAAKPPAVRRVTEILARGAAFDTSVPAACTAPDPELMLLGGAACSDGSKVGQGLITLDTGFPQPGRFVASPVEFFNNVDELIFLNHLAATETPRVVVRAAVHRRRSVAESPFLPGTPPDGAAIDTVMVRMDEVTRVTDGELRSYVTTPPRCPRRGHWTNRVQFTYADGVTQTVKTRSRCKD